MDTVIARAQYWNNTGLQLHATGYTTSEQFTHSHRNETATFLVDPHSLNMLIHLGDTVLYIVKYANVYNSKFRIHMDRVYMGVSQCVRF